MGKTTKTRTSVWTAIFRRIVQQLETDPEVRRVIGVENLRSWKGTTTDKTPFQPGKDRPVVRLTPRPSNVKWYSEDAQYGILTIKVEIAVESLSIDDVLDIWDVLVHSLNPGNSALTLALVALGAETGQITFADPLMDPKPDAEPVGYFYAEGGMSLQVIRSIST